MKLTRAATAASNVKRLVMFIRRLMMEIVTSWQTLMMYAKELCQARLSGDERRIAEAKRKHDEYRDMCLKSDRMLLGRTVGDM